MHNTWNTHARDTIHTQLTRIMRKRTTTRDTYTQVHNTHCTVYPSGLTRIMRKRTTTRDTYTQVHNTHCTVYPSGWCKPIRAKAKSCKSKAYYIIIWLQVCRQVFSLYLAPISIYLLAKIYLYCIRCLALYSARSCGCTHTTRNDQYAHCADCVRSLLT
jgi:hypothetical protein